MAVQHYNVPNPAAPGQLMGRYWDPTNSAIRDAQGTVTGLVHSIVNVTERVQAEAELAASQTRERAQAQALEEATRRQMESLQSILQQAPMGINVMRGPDFVVEFLNEEGAAIMGLPRAQLLNKPLFEALPLLREQGLDEAFRRVLQGEAFVYNDLPVLFDRTHSERKELGYYRAVYQPWRNERADVIGIITMVVDVTEHVLARQQLEAQRQQAQQLNQELETRVQERTRQLEAAQSAAERQRRQWHELFMRAPASICIFDGPEWVYEFVNPRYQAMFPGRELLGKRLVDALPEVADQPLMAILHHVYDTGEPFEANEVLVPLARTAEGPVEDIYFDLTYQARRNEAGQIDGFVTYAYDVTEQVLARQQREVQQRLVEALFEQAPTAIWVVQGPHYVFELVNPLMEHILGHSQAQLLGRPYLQALPELVSQGLPELLRRAWEGEQVTVKELGAHLAYHEAGQISYFNFVFEPLRDAQGQVHRIACVAVDVTDQVLARQQVQHLNQELQTSNEELHASNSQLVRTNVDLDNFVYTASHDLKSPISNIEGLLALLPELLPAAVRADEQVAPVLARMQESIERFKRTIAHLTDVSRLQAEFAQPAEPVSLAAIIEDVQEDLHFQFQATGAVLEVAVQNTQPRVFSPKNLRSLVYNLLSNALKYRHPERTPRVRISCQPADDSLVLTVQDNGLGLSDQQQHRLFQLFQRLHTHVEGSGVGLYAVKKIVENAGGTVAVASQKNVGTTFTLTFPA